MKTSHVIMGVGAASVLAYLIYKSMNKNAAVILKEENGEALQTPTPQAEQQAFASTIPVVMPSAKQPEFIPIISDPGEQKQEPITTVTPVPTSKPVYVAPVAEPVPVYIKPTVAYKTGGKIIEVSGFNFL